MPPMWLGSSAKETEPDDETDGNRKDNEEDNPGNGHTHSNTHHVHCMEERSMHYLLGNNNSFTQVYTITFLNSSSF